MGTALVTGGATGIGMQIVRRLCRDKMSVAICCNSSEKQALLLSSELNSAGGKTLVFKCDIKNSLEVRKMFLQAREALGIIDVLVNNAGVSQQKLFTDISDGDWENMCGVNLSGAFYCCREAVPDMVRAKYGRIINISSMWGQAGASCEVHYSAAKAGLIGLTKALAKELAPSGVTVNCVCPGAVDTAMLSGFSRGDIAALKEGIPMSRLGRAEEVAAAVSFLASEEAGYITGQVLGVNGGVM